MWLCFDICNLTVDIRGEEMTGSGSESEDIKLEIKEEIKEERMDEAMDTS